MATSLLVTAQQTTGAEREGARGQGASSGVIWGHLGSSGVTCGHLGSSGSARFRLT